MIDLHCHILPGIDDGAGSMATALAMAKDAWNSGVRAIVATPHCAKPGGDNNFYTPELMLRFRQLQDEIRKNGIELRIFPGMEVFATGEFPELLKNGKLTTLGDSRYMLVEFYFDESPEFIGQILRLVEEKGLIPVVAHPERYHCVQWEPELALGWADSGVVLQLNRGSIQGKLGQASMRCAWRLLHSGKVHVVASDAHGAQTRRAELRSVMLELGDRLSWAYASRLLIENPRNILLNKSVCTDVGLPSVHENRSEEY